MHETDYTLSFTVQSWECNPEGCLSLGALLRRAQQVATDQCVLLGLTQEVHEQNHTAFLLVKTAVCCYAPMPEGTQVTVTTRASEMRRAVFPRYTSFSAQDGTLLAAVDTQWVLVNVQTRHILRVMPPQMPKPFAQQTLPTLALIVHKAEAQPCGVQTATYTRCDRNRHINNTVYADIVCDALPPALLSQRGVRQFAITYHNEVPMGQQFELRQAVLTQNSYYFVGQANDKKYFEAEITLG